MWILAPGITYVPFLTINPDRSLPAPLLKAACGQFPVVWRPGDSAALQRAGTCSPLVPNFSGPVGEFVVAFPGDATMAAQFRQAPLASPPASALDLSSGRPTTCAPMGGYVALPQAPWFLPQSSPGFLALLQWRPPLLALRASFLPLETTFRKSCMSKMTAPAR